jgi:hypothetical protein
MNHLAHHAAGLLIFETPFRRTAFAAHADSVFRMSMSPGVAIPTQRRPFRTIFVRKMSPWAA